MDVGFDDWEGCDQFGLLSMHESVRTRKWQQLEQEVRTRHQLWVMQQFFFKESSIHENGTKQKQLSLDFFFKSNQRCERKAFVSKKLCCMNCSRNRSI